MSYSSSLHGLQPARFLSPWDSPCKNTGMGKKKKNTGMGCHFLLQGIFLTQGFKGLGSCFLGLVHLDRWILYHCAIPEAPKEAPYFSLKNCLLEKMFILFD